MERIEWGVRRIWPDGHEEVEQCDTRYVAELDVRIGKGTRAEVVRRTVTITDWEPLKPPTDEVDVLDGLHISANNTSDHGR